MTEQEQTIKNNLISLVKKGVQVYFGDKEDQCSKREQRSGVHTSNQIVTLLLVKDDSLDIWEQEIQNSEHAEAKRILEREHDYAHPNFYKAITSFIGDLQQDKSSYGI